MPTRPVVHGVPCFPALVLHHGLHQSRDPNVSAVARFRACSCPCLGQGPDLPRDHSVSVPTRPVVQKMDNWRCPSALANAARPDSAIVRKCCGRRQGEVGPSRPEGDGAKSARSLVGAHPPHPHAQCAVRSSKMKLGYLSLCNRASDNPGFIVPCLPKQMVERGTGRALAKLK